MFFLGGMDLEMVRIREHLKASNIAFADKGLAWGAKVSDYEAEITDALTKGLLPVLVELEWDSTNPLISIAKVVNIDHHGERSHEPASIIQVLNLLKQTPSRYDKLIAANDSGYIPAMKAMGATDDEEGATDDEVSEIRRLDRKAQGVTPEMEDMAEFAIKHAQRVGALVVLNLAHNKVSTVTDRLFSTWPDGKENLLVTCRIPDKVGEYEVYYFGRGDICKEFKEKFNGFGGGKGFGDPTGQAFAGVVTKRPTDAELFIQTCYM